MFLLPYCVLARTQSSSDFPWMENRERLPEVTMTNKIRGYVLTDYSDLSALDAVHRLIGGLH